MRKRKLLLEKIGIFALSIFLLLVLLLIAGLADPTVEFSDSGLEDAIRLKLENYDEPIKKSDLLTITELDATGMDIRDLEGIEFLSKLVVLNLDDNQVRDLSPLAPLSKLVDLSLKNNLITDLRDANFEEIAHLQLRSLSLSQNLFRPHSCEQERLSDITLLQHFTMLEELDLRDNYIEDVTALSSLVNLEVLDLRGNKITDIKALESLVFLQELNLRENELNCVESLRSMERLTYLNIHSNEAIETIEPLENLVNLQTLIMRNVPVGDKIDILNNLTNLQRLNLRGCHINNIAVLGNLMAEGALQDDPESGIEASVDLRENPLYIINGSDPHDDIRQFWPNISDRSPDILKSNLPPPSFSHSGGFYDESFFLELKTENQGAVIYYTLDGSEPTEESNIYQEPIYVDPNGNSEQLFTVRTTPKFEEDDIPGDLLSQKALDGVRWYEPDDIDQALIVRAKAKSKEADSITRTKTYFVGKTKYDHLNIPVVSIAADPKDFFDEEKGIYVPGEIDYDLLDLLPWEYPTANYHHRGISWERPIHLEFYDSNQLLGFSQNMGVRIHGGLTRAFRQKSLRLYSRTDYDHKGRINYPIFRFKHDLQDRIKVTNYNRLILRNSGNDFVETMFRDALLQSLLGFTNLDLQRYRPVILYLNGEYWGIHNVRERLDQYYLAEKYDLEPKEVVILESNLDNHVEIDAGSEGDQKHYIEMLNYIEEKDLSIDSHYNYINTQMDIDNFIDYQVAQIYCGNYDWPHNNIVYWRKKTDDFVENARHGHDGRWRWMVFDLDFGFGFYVGPIGGDFGHDAYTYNTLRWAITQSFDDIDWSTFLLRNLLANENFRNQFINRFADYLNTFFLPDIVIEKIDFLQGNISPYMQDHINRWGQHESLSSWEKDVEVMRHYAEKRPKYLYRHIVDYFGLKGTADVKVETVFYEGKIKINGMDVSQFITCDENPGTWSGTYFIDIPITIEAIPSSGYTFAGWEGDDKGDQNPLQLTLDQDINITAVFTK